MKKEEFKNYLRLHIEAENSRTNYFNRVKCFFDNYSEFKQENIDAYLVKKLDEGKGKSWFNQTMTAFRHYEKVINVNLIYPKYKKIYNQERDFLTEEELKEILPYMERVFERNGKFYSFVLKFLFYTGIRQDEMCKLRTVDIDFEKQLFLVKGPKDKDDKLVPFPKHLIPAMNRYLQTDKEKAFKVTQGIVDHIFKQLNEQLRYKKHLTGRMFRHSYAKHMLRMGIPVEKLQILLGHSNIQTTMIYAKPRREDALKAYFEKNN